MYLFVSVWYFIYIMHVYLLIDLCCDGHSAWMYFTVAISCIIILMYQWTVDKQPNVINECFPQMATTGLICSQQLEPGSLMGDCSHGWVNLAVVEWLWSWVCPGDCGVVYVFCLCVLFVYRCAVIVCPFFCQWYYSAIWSLNLLELFV